MATLQQLRIQTHPDLLESYRNLQTLLKKRKKSFRGAIEQVFFPRLAQKFGLLPKTQIKVIDLGAEPLWLSRKLLLQLTEKSTIRPQERGPATAIVASVGRPEALLALRSLANQSQGFEQILVAWDGVPAKQALQIEKSLQARVRKNFEFDFNEKRRGPGFCRNRLAQLSTNSTLVFFDDDNLALPNFHADLLAAKNFSGVQALSPARFTFHQQLNKPEALVAPIGSDPVSAFYSHLIGDSTLMIDRQVFLNARGFSENREEPEDVILFLELMKLNISVHSYPLPLFHYRRSLGSRSLTLDFKSVTEKTLHFYQTELPDFSKNQLRRLHDQCCLGYHIRSGRPWGNP